MTALHSNIFLEQFKQNNRCVAAQRSASGEALFCIYKTTPAQDDDEYRWQHAQIERWIPENIKNHVAPSQNDPVRLRHMGTGYYHYNEDAKNIILPPYSPPKPIVREIKYNNTNIHIKELERIFNHIPIIDVYNKWFPIACGAKRTGYPMGMEEEVYQIFDNWSSKSVQYNSKQNRSVWDKICVMTSGREVTLGTLIRLARDNGYII